MLQTRWIVITASLLLGRAVKQARADELSFYWWFYGQDDYTIPSCSALAINFTPNPNASVPAVPPYYLIAYTAGNIPTRFLATNGAPFSWQVAYPAGTQMLLSFTDSAGNSGGVGPLYTVIGATSGSCRMYGDATSPLSFTLNPSVQPATCQSIVLNPIGGVLPYTLTYAVTADVPYNTTFPNSSISFKNTLSGGGTFMVSLSDANGNYANSSGLIYSGGGTDTSCFVAGNPTGTDKPKSGGSNTPKTPTENEPHGIAKYKAVIGGLGAVVALLIAGAIWFFYRKKRKQQDAVAIASSARNSAPSSPNDAFAFNGGGGNGPEKYDSNGRPIVPGGGGGMWRPESPLDYPGFAAAPVRFHVTNPDDDGRSEFSVGTGRARSGTVTTEDYQRSRGYQRQSLIDQDHNALYPPTAYTHLTSEDSQSSPKSGNYTMSTSPTSATRLRQASTPSLIGSETNTDIDQNYTGTFLSSASSTDDHYATVPASSAGRIATSNNTTTRNSLNTFGGGQNSNNSNGRRTEQSRNAQSVRSSGASTISGTAGGGYETETSYQYEGDEEEEYDDTDGEDPWAQQRRTRSGFPQQQQQQQRQQSLTRTDSYQSTSNAYGSPFADSQKPSQPPFR